MTRGRRTSSVLGALLLAGGALGGCASAPPPEPDSELCDWIESGRDELLGRPFGGGGAQVLVIGDSYTQGLAPDGPADAWPAKLAALSGTTVTVDGMGSTGYTTTGFCPGKPYTYADRLSGFDGAEDTTVIVQGSVNDGLGGDPDDVEPSAGAALEEAEGAGRVIVVGPPAIPALDAAVLDTIDRGLAAAAREHDAVYVSLLAEDIPISADDVHPTPDGQERIALLVAAALG